MVFAELFATVLGYIMGAIMMLLFFAPPVLVIVFFVIGLVRYISAKIKNKKLPGTYSKQDIKIRGVYLAVMSVALVALVGITVGFIVLMYYGIAYM